MEKFKIKLSAIGNSIMNDPIRNLAKLENLIGLIRENRLLYSQTKWTLLSLNLIFNNILPNYKITRRGENRDNRKLTFEVESKLFYEEKLLRLYKDYIRILRSILARTRLKSKPNRKIYQKHFKLITIASYCVADLLCTHFDFNCGEDLIEIIAKFLCDKHHPKESKQKAIGKIKSLFFIDHQGHIKLLLIKRLSEQIIKHEFCIDAKVLNVFESFSCEVDQSIDPNNSSMDRSKKIVSKYRNKPKSIERNTFSRKEKKMMRKEIAKQLRKELLEIEAVENSGVSYRNNVKCKNILLLFYMQYPQILCRHLENNVLLKRWHLSIAPIVLNRLISLSSNIDASLMFAWMEQIKKLLAIENKNLNQITVRIQLLCLDHIFQLMNYFNSTNDFQFDSQSIYLKLLSLISQNRSHLFGINFQLFLQCVKHIFSSDQVKLSSNQIENFVNKLAEMAFESNPIECSLIVAKILEYFRSNKNLVNQTLDLIQNKQPKNVPSDDANDPGDQLNSTLLNVKFLAENHFDFAISNSIKQNINHRPLSEVSQS
ncbi:hypothetical protein NH340_JMT07884 [Sarcoptes scabiei]|nr:hypothetical protein NH340_JMT07884 [Sarcoptes scabiei]